MVCGQVPRCRRLCRPRPFLLALVVAICLFCQTLTPLMTSSVLSAVVNGIAPNKLTKTQQGRYKEISPSETHCFLPGSNSQTVKKAETMHQHLWNYAVILESEKMPRNSFSLLILKYLCCFLLGQNKDSNYILEDTVTDQILDFWNNPEILYNRGKLPRQIQSIISLYIYNLELDKLASRKMSKHFLFNRELHSHVELGGRQN